MMQMTRELDYSPRGYASYEYRTIKMNLISNGQRSSLDTVVTRTTMEDDHVCRRICTIRNLRHQYQLRGSQ
jgi:hypothetical protein